MVMNVPLSEYADGIAYDFHGVALISADVQNGINRFVPGAVNDCYMLIAMEARIFGKYGRVL